MILKVCGVAVIGLASALILKKSGGMYAAVIICTFLTLIIFVSDNSLYTLVDSIEDIGSYSTGYWKTAIKALGVGFITSAVSEICSSAGEETLSHAVLFAGKAELLLLCLPMVRELLSVAGKEL